MKNRSAHKKPTFRQAQCAVFLRACRESKGRNDEKIGSNVSSVMLSQVSRVAVKLAKYLGLGFMAEILHLAFASRWRGLG